MKIIKITGVAVATLIVLCICLVLSLYWSPVLTFVLNRAGSSIGEDNGMEIHVDYANLDFPLTLEMKDLHVDTIASVGRMMVEVTPAELLAHKALVNDGALEDAVLNINILESEDTTSTPLGWDIAVSRFKIRNTQMSLSLPQMPKIAVTLPEMNIGGLSLGIDDGAYSATHADMKDATLAYDTLQAEKVCLDADSLSYSDPMQIHACINRLSFVTDMYGMQKSTPIILCGTMEGNMQKMTVRGLDLNLPQVAHICAEGSIEHLDNTKKLKADVQLRLQIEDSNPISRLLPKGMLADYRLPKTATFDGHIHYDGEQGDILTDFTATIDNARLKADAEINTEKSTIALEADVNGLNLRNYVPQFGVGLVSAKISLHSDGFDFKHSKTQVTADIRRLQYADYDLQNMSISGTLNNGQLNSTIHSRNKFLDADFLIKGDVKRIMEMNWAKPTFDRLNAEVQATVRRADLYGLHLIDKPLIITAVTANAKIANNRIKTNIASRNNLLYGNINIEGMLSRKDIKATIITDISNIDIKAAGLSDAKYVTGLCAHFDIGTDMNEYLSIHGFLSDVTFDADEVGYVPFGSDIDIYADRETMHAIINGPSLTLNMQSQKGFMQFKEDLSAYLDELSRQTKAKEINRTKLQNLLPDISLVLNTNQESPIMPFVRHLGYDFEEVEVEMHINKQNGINSTASVQGLVADSIRIDDISLLTNEDSLGTAYFAKAQNYKDSNSPAFKAIVHGHLAPRTLITNAQLYDGKDSLGIALGAQADFTEEGIKAYIKDSTVILGYKEFAVNEDNYVAIDKSNRISAHLELLGNDGTGIQIYTDNDNNTATQDLTVSINRFALGQLSEIIPFFPKISGNLSGDFHLTQTNGEWTIASDMGVQSLVVEGAELNNVNTEFTLMPMSTGENILSATMYKDDILVADVSGQYNSTSDRIDALIKLPRLPLEMANAFLPNDLINLYGKITADNIRLTGTTASPIVNGEIMLDSAYVTSPPYGISLHFKDTQAKIENSRLLMKDMALYGYNENPIVVNGELDFSRLDDINIDMRLKTNKFQIVSAKKTATSIVYGKAFANFTGMLKGNNSMMRLTGRADLLSSTDLTYILKDSPLNTDDRLKDLVTFTDFRDTTQVAKSDKPKPTNINMNLTLNVEPGAHIRCNINEDGSNYVNLEGGGELRMRYSPATDLTLTGRYTLTSGDMRYSLPVIPLKTFTIKNGSYVEFSGDAMNPWLNITATQKNNANVSDATSTRSVAFETGLKVSQALNNMKIEFILNAPEDLTVQSELSMMNAEQREKLAIIMLSTGIYASDGNTSGFSMNNALNAFIQNEISNITGNMLEGVDLSMGIDSKTDYMGSHTDYSFKFAKRFWNNRLGVSVGGVVSNANKVYGQNGIDNVTMEYRLDNTAMRTLQVFYKRDMMDPFEGHVSQYGAGIVLKKQMEHIRELFHFRKDKKTPTPVTDRKKEEKTKETE